MAEPGLVDEGTAMDAGDGTPMNEDGVRDDTRLVRFRLIFGSCAVLLCCSALFLAALSPWYGGKMKALFETADAELDTVDSNL